MADIRWFGHNCFRIKGKQATVIMDPVGKNTGYSLPKQPADIVTLSHEHPGHANLAAIKPDYRTVSGPGEYEISDVFITGIRSYHDKEKGSEQGYNTMYVVDLDGLRYAHLGDLGHPLSENDIEAFGAVDVLFAPAGGGPLLSPSEVAEVVGSISPKMVIPMQFQTAKGDTSRDDVSAFCKQLGVETPVPIDKVVAKASDLTDQMQVVILKPDS